MKGISLNTPKLILPSFSAARTQCWGVLTGSAEKGNPSTGREQTSQVSAAAASLERGCLVVSHAAPQKALGERNPALNKGQGSTVLRRN